MLEGKEKFKPHKLKLKDEFVFPLEELQGEPDYDLTNFIRQKSADSVRDMVGLMNPGEFSLYEDRHGFDLYRQVMPDDDGVIREYWVRKDKKTGQITKEGLVHGTDAVKLEDVKEGIIPNPFTQETKRQELFKKIYDDTDPTTGQLKSEIAKGFFENSMTNSNMYQLGNLFNEAMGIPHYGKHLSEDPITNKIDFKEDGVYYDNAKLNLTADDYNALSSWFTEKTEWKPHNDGLMGFFEQAANFGITMLWDAPLFMLGGKLTSSALGKLLPGLMRNRTIPGKFLQRTLSNFGMLGVASTPSTIQHTREGGINALLDDVKHTAEFSVLAGGFGTVGDQLGIGVGKLLGKSEALQLSETANFLRRNPKVVETLTGGFTSGMLGYTTTDGDTEERLAVGMTFAAMHFMNKDAWRGYMKGNKKAIMIENDNWKDVKAGLKAGGNLEQVLKDAQIPNYYEREGNKLYRIDDYAFTSKGDITRISEEPIILDTKQASNYKYITEAVPFAKKVMREAFQDAKLEKLADKIEDKYFRQHPNPFDKDTNPDAYQNYEYNKALAARQLAVLIYTKKLGKQLYNNQLPDDLNLDKFVNTTSELLKTNPRVFRQFLKDNFVTYMSDPKAWKEENMKFLPEDYIKSFESGMNEIEKAFKRGYNALMMDDIQRVGNEKAAKLAEKRLSELEDVVKPIKEWADVQEVLGKGYPPDKVFEELKRLGKFTTKEEISDIEQGAKESARDIELTEQATKEIIKRQYGTEFADAFYNLLSKEDINKIGTSGAIPDEVKKSLDELHTEYMTKGGKVEGEWKAYQKPKEPTSQEIRVEVMKFRDKLLKKGYTDLQIAEVLSLPKNKEPNIADKELLQLWKINKYAHDLENKETKPTPNMIKLIDKMGFRESIEKESSQKLEDMSQEQLDSSFKKKYAERLAIEQQERETGFKAETVEIELDGKKTEVLLRSPVGEGNYIGFAKVDGVYDFTNPFYITKNSLMQRVMEGQEKFRRERATVYEKILDYDNWMNEPAPNPELSTKLVSRVIDIFPKTKDKYKRGNRGEYSASEKGVSPLVAIRALRDSAPPDLQKTYDSLNFMWEAFDKMGITFLRIEGEQYYPREIAKSHLGYNYGIKAVFNNKYYGETSNRSPIKAELDLVKTLLHEGLHGFMKGVKDLPTPYAGHLHQAFYELGMRMNPVIKRMLEPDVLSNAPQSAKDILEPLMHSLKNYKNTPQGDVKAFVEFSEIITYPFADPAFAYFLSTIPYDGMKRTRSNNILYKLYEVVTGWVKEKFGTTETAKYSVLDEIYNVFERTFSEHKLIDESGGFHPIDYETVKKLQSEGKQISSVQPESAFSPNIPPRKIEPSQLNKNDLGAGEKISIVKDEKTKELEQKLNKDVGWGNSAVAKFSDKESVPLYRGISEYELEKLTVPYREISGGKFQSEPEAYMGASYSGTKQDAIDAAITHTTGGRKQFWDFMQKQPYQGGMSQPKDAYVLTVEAKGKTFSIMQGSKGRADIVRQNEEIPRDLGDMDLGYNLKLQAKDIVKIEKVNADGTLTEVKLPFQKLDAQKIGSNKELPRLDAIISPQPLDKKPTADKVADNTDVFLKEIEKSEPSAKTRKVETEQKLASLKDVMREREQRERTSAQQFTYRDGKKDVSVLETGRKAVDRFVGEQRLLDLGNKAKEYLKNLAPPVFKAEWSKRFNDEVYRHGEDMIRMMPYHFNTIFRRYDGWNAGMTWRKFADIDPKTKQPRNPDAIAFLDAYKNYEYGRYTKMIPEEMTWEDFGKWAGFNDAQKQQLEILKNTQQAFIKKMIEVKKQHLMEDDRIYEYLNATEKNAIFGKNHNEQDAKRAIAEQPNIKEKTVNAIINGKYAGWGKYVYYNSIRPSSPETIIVEMSKSNPKFSTPEMEGTGEVGRERIYTYFDNWNEANTFMNERMGMGWSKDEAYRIKDLINRKDYWGKLNEHQLMELAIEGHIPLNDEIIQKLREATKKGVDLHAIHKDYVPGMKYSPYEYEQQLERLGREAIYGSMKSLYLDRINRNLRNWENELLSLEGRQFSPTTTLPSKAELQKMKEEYSYSQRYYNQLRAPERTVVDKIRGATIMWQVGGLKPAFLFQQSMQGVQTTLHLAYSILNKNGIGTFNDAVGMFMEGSKNAVNVGLALRAKQRGLDLGDYKVDKDLINHIEQLDLMGKIRAVGIGELMGEKGEMRDIRDLAQGFGAEADYFYNKNTGSKLFDGAVKWGNSLGAMMEKYTRIQAASTFYEVGKKMGLAGERLTNFMADGIDKSMAEWGKGGRSPFLDSMGVNPNQGTLANALKKSFMTYKTFSFYNYGLYEQLIRQRQWGALGTKMMFGAGLHGITAFPLMASLFGLASLFSDEDIDYNIMKMADYIDDKMPLPVGSILRGGFGSLAGIDLRNTFDESTPLLTDLYANTWAKSWEGKAIELALGAPFGFTKDAVAGAAELKDSFIKMLDSDEFITEAERESSLKRVRKMSPVFLRNVFLSMDYDKDGVKYDGKNIVTRQDLTSYDVFMKALSFPIDRINRGFLEYKFGEEAQINKAENMITEAKKFIKEVQQNDWEDELKRSEINRAKDAIVNYKKEIILLKKQLKERNK